MFSKISRYRKLPDVVTIDIKGRKLASKSLRLSPDVSGQFRHTIEDVDRLDHLASTYYRQPRKWWRICDANPEFLSPQALLGKEPIVTYRFPLTFGADPAWAALLKQLSGMVGVEQAVVGDDWASIVVTFNQINLDIENLADAIEAEEFHFTIAGQPQPIGRVGKQIIIPPDAVG